MGDEILQVLSFDVLSEVEIVVGVEIGAVAEETCEVWRQHEIFLRIEGDQGRIYCLKIHHFPNITTGVLGDLSDLYGLIGLGVVADRCYYFILLGCAADR